jgi:hypothetical protein
MSEDTPHHGDPIFELESTSLGQWLRVFPGTPRHQGILMAWECSPEDVASALRAMAESLEVAGEPSPLERAFAAEPQRSIVDAALRKLGDPSST